MTFETLTFTTEFNRCYDITADVQAVVDKSGVTEGACVITTKEMSIGIGLPSHWDKKGWDDMMDDMHRLIATRVDFKDTTGTPYDAAARLKTAFVGNHANCIIKEGKLLLGSSQGILIHEFGNDGNQRTVDVAVL